MNRYRTFLKGLDFAFETLLILLLAFIWSRYFIDNLALSVITAVILTLSIAFIIARKNKVNIEKANLVKISSKKLENFRSFFIFSNANAILSEVKRQEGEGIISENVLFIQNRIFALYNKDKPVNKDEIIFLIQKLDTTKITEINILCTNIEADTANFAKNIANIHFNILTLKEIASKYFKQKLEDDYFAQNCKIHYKQNAIITFKTFLLMLLMPQNAKGYFFSAIILIFASLIVPNKLYYYIFASILLILALCSKIVKHKH